MLHKQIVWAPCDHTAHMLTLKAVVTLTSIYVEAQIGLEKTHIDAEGSDDGIQRHRA